MTMKCLVVFLASSNLKSYEFRCEMLTSLITTLLIIFVSFVLGFNDVCVNINKENGRCVSLRDCGLTIETLLASPEAYYFAKESKCGSGVSMVCCGPSGYQSSNTITSTASPQEEKIRLSKFSDSSVCGIHASSSKIKGGVVTEFEEFPWLAGLEYVSNYDHQNKGIRCGGSLLNHEIVLSAAHCITHHELVLVKVWLGATNISSDEKNCLNFTGDNHCVNSIQKFNVSRTFIHPFYNRLENLNDIGLIKLKQSVKFNSFVRPICLPSTDSLPLRINSYLTVAGWGANENSTSSETKLKVELPLQNNTACNNLVAWETTTITSEQLCVGGEAGKDSCQGDSGGPLMKSYRNAIGDIQWVQIGIVSYGVGCGVRGRPGVYVKVASYIDWIIQRISERGAVCITPNKESAICVPMGSCKVILDAIKTKNSTTTDFAKQSQCGYDSEVLVCCGSEGYHTDDELITTGLPSRTVCGLEKEENRVLGDGLTNIGEFPWMAVLEYKSKLTNQSAGIRCGGTLINNRYVLTAAHCIIDVEFQLTKVWLGDWQLSTDPDCKTTAANTKCGNAVEKINIKNEIPHPFYSKRIENNDIGLLELEHDVEYSEYIRPICLPPVHIPNPAVGTNVTVAGWGARKNGTTSDFKLKVAVPLLSNANCKTTFESRAVRGNQLCVGDEEGKYSCQGDSGGPVMRTYEDKVNQQAQWYQEGVISSTDGCGQLPAGYPTIYTRVSRYLNWIINNIIVD